MKKLLFFVAAAAMMAACSTEELANSGTKQDPNGDPINFSVYTPRTTTRAGVPGSISNTSLKTSDHKDYGFGIFGYYTAGTTYDQNAIPNFMWNQQVKWDATDSRWEYEPVKYWPNEYGNAAMSDDIDYVSFFAYAPWTQFTPSSGLPIITPIADYDAFANKLGLPGVTTLATYKNYIKATTDDAAKAALDALNVDFIQNKNITEISKNTATGDPIIKYVVDTNPAFSVDLLYGVAAENASYSPINTTAGASAQNTAGKPFLNLVKPQKPAEDKLNFYLQHALSKIKVTIDYIADAATPDGPSKDINSNYTRIYVRSITFGGFAMKGALNLNSTETMTVTTGATNYTVGKPKWLSYDGTSELSINDITFFDGRKDGREGATNGAQNSETPVGLNPNIVENEGLVTAGTTAIPLTHWATAEEATAANATEKTSGVTNTPQNVFGGVGDYFYVIPRNNNEPVNMTIVYDVETIDDNLAGKLSDNATYGSTIENVISKNDIFSSGKDFMPGYTYHIKIHLGMTSVKVDAEVLAWTADNNAVVNLPDNQY